MIDLAVQVVTAIVSGAGDSLAAKGVTALGHLISELRTKFRGDPAARGTLEMVLETPDDLAASEDLVSTFRDRILHDTDFSEWLAGLWAEVGPDLQVDASRSANVVHGNVQGNVVQTRDVQGGIHIGPT